LDTPELCAAAVLAHNAYLDSHEQPLRDAIGANRQAIIEHVAAVAGIDIGPAPGQDQ
jgi:hypothetical protein